MSSSKFALSILFVCALAQPACLRNARMNYDPPKMTEGHNEAVNRDFTEVNNMVVSRQGGITNIGIEGIMLFGSYFGFVSAYLSGSWIVGVAASVLAGLLASLVIGVVHLKYDTHIFVIGFAVNMLALGSTRFLLQQTFKVSGALLVDKPVILPIVRVAAADLGDFAKWQ